MTPPGDPLKFGFRDAVSRLFLRLAPNYPDLKEWIQTAIAEEAPLSITPIWKKTEKNGRVVRGAIVTVEMEDTQGKTTVFEAMSVKGKDRRGIVKVKQGSFSEKEATQFCTEYDAEPEGKGGKP